MLNLLTDITTSTQLSQAYEHINNPSISGSIAYYANGCFEITTILLGIGLFVVYKIPDTNKANKWATIIGGTLLACIISSGVILHYTTKASICHNNQSITKINTRLNNQTRFNNQAAHQLKHSPLINEACKELSVTDLSYDPVIKINPKVSAWTYGSPTNGTIRHHFDMGNVVLSGKNYPIKYQTPDGFTVWFTNQKGPVATKSRTSAALTQNLSAAKTATDKLAPTSVNMDVTYIAHHGQANPQFKTIITNHKTGHKLATITTDTATVYGGAVTTKTTFTN